MTESSLTKGLAEEFLKFLPVQLAIRYTVTRPPRWKNAECFHAEIVYLERVRKGVEDGGFPWKYARITSTGLIRNWSLEPDPLKFESDLGSEGYAKQQVCKVLDFWRRNVAPPRGCRPTVEWLEPKPFVGVLLIGEDETRVLTPTSQHLMLYHGLLHGLIISYEIYLKAGASFGGSTRNDHELLGGLRGRFSAFVAQSRENQARRLLEE